MIPQLDGLLLVDKPPGKTSHDIVDFVRRRFSQRKVGHCGTLDPIATGLLMLVIGKATREDHGQIMNTMIRCYSGGVEAQKKQDMAFELSAQDLQLLKFARLFRERFMDIRANLPVIEALDLCWQTLAECFEPQELLMKQALVEKYYPKPKARSTGEFKETVQAA